MFLCQLLVLACYCVNVYIFFNLFCLSVFFLFFFLFLYICSKISKEDKVAFYRLREACLKIMFHLKNI